ncbi:uncharacterized protein [Rutidosis leptorrhynchoides]|uniref:uncharacterized protein n=1 Tax=Rutidosis leptorrhynchoides TaxID=125765 RepID=UPI003A995918
MADKQPFHPALTISNIKNLIPITLELNNSLYNSWSRLFKLHCTTYGVLDHIIPPIDDSSSSDTTNTTNPNQDPQWLRLDAIVLQWIYGTLSTELLNTVMEQDETTAAAAWQFSTIKLDDFANVSAYCQQLKSLADQLMNVGDKLILEEIRKQKQAINTIGNDTALVTTINSKPEIEQSQSRYNNQRGRGNNMGNYNRGRNSGNRGCGRSNSYQSGAFSQSSLLTWLQRQLPYNNWGYQQNPWTQQIPPCPFPTTNWVRPNTNQAGLLGPRPAQAHNVETSSFCPTELNNALHTMSHTPPD